MTGQYGMGGCVRKCQKFECVPVAQSSFPIAAHTHTKIDIPPYTFQAEVGCDMDISQSFTHPVNYSHLPSEVWEQIALRSCNCCINIH